MAKVTKPTVTAPEKPEGYGLSNKGEGKSPQIRHTRPEVARHVARMIIKKNMDAEAAVAEMLKADYPDATDAQIVSLARTIEASPHVQREMSKILEEIGCGPEAQKKLIGLLWAEALGKNDKRWGPAVAQLSKITGAEKASLKNEKMPVLKLEGMKEGLTKMLGEAAPTNDSDVSVELPEETDIITDEDAQ